MRAVACSGGEVEVEGGGGGGGGEGEGGERVRREEGFGKRVSALE